MKALIKNIVARVSPQAYERALGLSLMKSDFAEARRQRVFASREALWEHAIGQLPAAGAVSYLEFGVWDGYSMRHISRSLSRKDALLVGCDSFEGLPEDWDNVGRATFDVAGRIPQIDDARVTFVKGWFQKTLDEALDRAKAFDPERALLVNFDADLYSSTLYLLTRLDRIGRPYLAVFDEFYGHEPRALYNYLQSYGGSVKFLGQTCRDGAPLQVLCRIEPGYKDSTQTAVSSA